MGRARVSPFFHALVVAGAGISASDCGGVSADVGTSKTGEPDAGGASSTGGRSSTGGGKASGGASASGGAPQTGGVEASGGSPMDGPPPPATTVAQWDCSAVFGVCHFTTTQDTELHPLALQGPCSVDPSRPRTAADCGPGEWFACQAALWSGVRSESIYVNCECVAGQDGGCSIDVVGARCQVGYCDRPRLACGCAEPVILR